MMARKASFVSRARCSAQRCFAEPGSYQAPASGTAPAQQRTAPRRAEPVLGPREARTRVRCAASGERGLSKKRMKLRALRRADHDRVAFRGELDVEPAGLREEARVIGLHGVGVDRACGAVAQ